MAGSLSDTALARAMPTAGMLLEGGQSPRWSGKGEKSDMSPPRDQYPNPGRRYPAAAPEPAESTRPSFGPGVEAELHRLAPSRVTVLLLGADARELQEVAMALHERSPRARSPFITFACEGLDAAQVELGLFGGPAHEPPAGGAIAHTAAGTLYVAAIDELPLLVQPRFLRFLDQERRIRVVASSPRDLPELVRQGQYRLDLAERLSLVTLALPGRRHSV
jgi:DNA-binding NtrC family response regulator